MKGIVIIWACFALVPGQISAQDAVGEPAESPELEQHISAEASDEWLNLSLVDLMEIQIVSASKRQQSISEAPAVISVITAEQIKRRGYQSVGEALESIAGLDMLHDHSQYNLGVRGVNGGKRTWSRIVKVMIDNQPVSFRPSSDNFLGEELIPIVAVDRIEIIRGPASALYGANAFLGVINIITKTGQQFDGGQVTQRFGFGEDTFLLGGNLALGTKVGDLSILLSGTYVIPLAYGYQLVPLPDATEVHRRAEEKSERNVAVPQSYFAKVEYGNENMGVVSVDFNYQLLDRYAEFQDWGVLTHNNRLSLYNTYVRAKYALTFWDDFSTMLSVAYNKSEPTENEHLDFNEEREDYIWYNRRFGASGIDVTLETAYNIDKWSSITLGGDFTRENHQLLTYYRIDEPHDNVQANEMPTSGTDTELGSEVFHNTGVYIQSIIYPFRLLEYDVPLGITGGFRFDYHNMYGSALNYRVGAVYQITDWLYSKLLFGTSFKAPSSTQLYSNFLLPQDVVGNRELKPETAKTYELALGGRLFDRLTFMINGFFTEVEDKVEITAPESGKANNEYPQNIASTRSYGAEAELTFFIQQYLNAYANYSYQKSKVNTIDPLSIDNERLKIDTDLYPPHLIKFGVNLSVPQVYLSLNVEGRYVDSRIGSKSNNKSLGEMDYLIDRYQLDDYFLLDCAISSYRLKLFGDGETQIMAKIYNVFDTEYAYPGFKDFDIPGFRRTFVFSLNQRF